MWQDITVLEGHAASIFRDRRRPYKMLVSYHIAIQFHNPEDDLNIHHCENLKYFRF